MKTLFYDRKNDCLVTSDRLRRVSIGNSETPTQEPHYAYKTNHRSRKFFDKLATQNELVFLRFVSDSYTATLHYNREPITEVGETVPELANPDALPHIPPPEIEPSLGVTQEECLRVVTQKVKCNTANIKKLLFANELPSNYWEAEHPDNWVPSGKAAEEVVPGVFLKNLECVAVEGLWAELKVNNGAIVNCELKRSA